MPESSILEALNKARSKQNQNKEHAKKAVFEAASATKPKTHSPYRGPYAPASEGSTRREEKERDYAVEDSLYMDVGENMPPSPKFVSPSREDQDLLNSNLSTAERVRRAAIKEEVRKDQEQEKELENEVRRRKVMGVKKPTPSGSLHSASMAPPAAKKSQKPKEMEKPRKPKEGKKGRSLFNPAWILTGVLLIVLLCLIVLCKKAIDSDPQITYATCSQDWKLCVSLIARAVRGLLL